MYHEKNSPLSTILAALVFLLITAFFLYSHSNIFAETRRKTHLRKAALVIRLSIRKYALDHRGDCPPDNMIKGGNRADDVLIRKNYLKRYPPNPFTTPNRPMRNVPGKSFSPGDFIYRRSPRSHYGFFLGVMGESPAENGDGFSVKFKD